MGFQKRAVDALFKFSNFFADVAGIIKIAKSIEVDGPKESRAVPHNIGLEVKEVLRQRMQEVGPSNQHKG